jgi:hypothetical protein
MPLSHCTVSLYPQKYEEDLGGKHGGRVGQMYLRNA